MPDLTTRYMGLNLQNPIIVGSSGLTSSVRNIAMLEENGAAAIVLKSLFEEQILIEIDAMRSEPGIHSEELDYIRNYTRQHNLDEYLNLLSAAKKEVSIPIIPSINCSTAGEWTTFARNLEDAGADGIELNLFIMPGNIRQTGEEIEKTYLDIVQSVQQQISVPLAVKIGSYFTGMANMISSLSASGVNAVVLFNRFHQPDIDLNTLTLTSGDILSQPGENRLPLRWVGMLSGQINCDMAATTGIHDGPAVLKNVLAGAKAVQIVSTVYKNGPEVIGDILRQIEAWMQKRNIKTLAELIGRLSLSIIEDPVLYERAQFMRYFSNADM